MGYIVVTLREIRKKYNLKANDKITLKQLEEISKNENLSMKELELLFQMNRRSFSRLMHKKQKRIVINTFETKNINDKDIKEVIKIGKISAEELVKLSKRYKSYYLRQILCISEYSYRNIVMGKKEYVRVLNRKIKTRVELLGVYLKSSSRYYKEWELRKICSLYSITLRQYLYYSSRTEKYYRFQKNILKNNEKGLWIGKTFRLSKEFLEDNFNELYNKCKKVAINMANYYGEKGMIEDFTEIAFDNVMEVRRNSRKKFPV